MRRPVILLATLALAVAGCGGDDEGGGGAGDAGVGGGTETQTTPTTPSGSGETGAGGQGEGKELFAGTCGGCHTLSDAGTTGTFGPNLDDLKPDKERVLTAIKEGPGAMPENLFTGEQAETVATYVADVAGS